MSSLARISAATGLGVGLERGERAPASATWADFAVAGLGGLLILPLGLSDGGYFGRSYTALTLALGAGAALAWIHSERRRLSPTLIATVLPIGLLALWAATSSLWADAGATVGLEARRCVLYVVALVAIGLVARSRERAFLLSVTAALSIVAVAGLALRAISGVPVDPYFGGLLAEPVGYPNAMGVLAATGVVLAVGLGASAGARAARMLRGVAPVLVLVLGLSGSRGGALALGAGLVALLALSARAVRLAHVGSAAAALLIGGGAWVLVAAAGSTGLPLVGAAAAAAALGVAHPRPGRRATLSLVFGSTVAAAVVLATHPPATTSSFRSAYWAAALAEARERPLLGSGAGSFYLTWRERRPVPTDVRDAHGLYVESLSELGPLGLLLVVAVVAVPLGVAARRREDPVAAAAGAGFAVFAVHAALDWDWEMPVVTLVALGCAGALLTRDRDDPTRERL